jgi:hypothetical protein
MTKKESLGKEEFLMFLCYLNMAVDFDIFHVDKKEYDEIGALLANENMPIDSVLEKFNSFERVIFVQLFLVQNDFITTATQLVPDLKAQMTKCEDLTLNIGLGDTIYVISLNKVIVKRNRKTTVELECELETAVQQEKFEEAAKLRDILNKRKNRKKKAH